MKLGIYNCVTGTTKYANKCDAVTTWVVLAYFLGNLSYFMLWIVPSLQQRMILKSLDKFLCKYVPFWGYDDTCYLEAKSPKPNFRMLIGIFQVKLAKYQNLYFMKATALIPTKFFSDRVWTTLCLWSKQVYKYPKMADHCCLWNPAFTILPNKTAKI